MNSARIKYKRVILKVTGELLSGAEKYGIDGKMVRSFAEPLRGEVPELREWPID